MFEDEREYNRNGVDIDEVKLKGTTARLEYSRFYSQKLYYQLGLEYLFDGYYQEEYKEELDFINDAQTDVKGVREPDLTLFYALDTTDYTNLTHAIRFYYRPKIFTSKASRYSSGGGDIEFAYYYNTWIDNFTIEGDIYSRIHGKRESRSIGQIEESTSAYTEVGLNISGSYRLGNFVPGLNFGYASTTEYKSRNKFFKRDSDKGFGVNVEVSLAYSFSEAQQVEFSFYSRSFQFNSIEEEEQETDIAYELERRHISLAYTMELD